MKFIYLRQVSKQHISFVLQWWWHEVAKLRVIQLCKITLGIRVRGRFKKWNNKETTAKCKNQSVSLQRHQYKKNKYTKKILLHCSFFDWETNYIYCITYHSIVQGCSHFCIAFSLHFLCTTFAVAGNWENVSLDPMCMKTIGKLCLPRMIL